MTLLPRQTTRVLARDLVGCAEPSELVSWAVSALVNGLDTPALRALAGMDLNGRSKELRQFDASTEFRKALTQLDVEIPSRNDALRFYLRWLIDGIVNGELAPQATVEAIFFEVLVPLQHPSDLAAWRFLWEGIEPETHRDIEGTALDDKIRETAQTYSNAREG